MGLKMNMYSGNQMTAANDGMIYNKMIPSSGILHGCEMTFMGANQIHISKGYLMIKGRLCTVTEEVLRVEMANTDTEIPGRLYIRADLTDVQNPVYFASVASDPLPELVQDEDFNYSNGIYEMELGQYTAGRTAITNFATTCSVIEDAGGVKKLIGEPDKYNAGSTYKAGDICIYQDVMYKANTDITEPENWNPVHWDVTSLFEITNQLTDNIGGVRLGYTADGQPGYITTGEDGADTVVPFGAGIEGLYKLYSGNLARGTKVPGGRTGVLPANTQGFIVNVLNYYESAWNIRTKITNAEYKVLQSRRNMIGIQYDQIYIEVYKYKTGDIDGSCVLTSTDTSNNYVGAFSFVLY